MEGKYKERLDSELAIIMAERKPGDRWLGVEKIKKVSPFSSPKTDSPLWRLKPNFLSAEKPKRIIRKVLALNIFFLRKNSLPPMERFSAKIALDVEKVEVLPDKAVSPPKPGNRFWHKNDERVSYRIAFEEFQKGNHDVEFPLGTYKMRLQQNVHVSLEHVIYEISTPIE